MAIALVSASTKTANATANANVTVDKPTDLAVGDLMVAYVGCFNDNSTDFTLSIPSGWSAITSNGVESNGSNQYYNFRSFYKIATAPDVAASNFTFSVSDGTPDYISGAILRITGSAVSIPAPVNDWVGLRDGGATPSSADVAITPTRASSLILQFWTVIGTLSFSDYAIATSNPSWSEAFDVQNNTFTYACGYAIRPEITSTGAFSCSIGGGGAGTDSAVMTCAISPAYGATVTAVAGEMVLDSGTTAIKYGTKIVADYGKLILKGIIPSVKKGISWTQRSKNSSSWTNRNKSN